MGRTTKQVNDAGHVSKKRLLPQLTALERYVYPLAVRRRDFLIETGELSDGGAHLLLPALPHMKKPSGPGTNVLVIASSVEAVRKAGASVRRISELKWLDDRVLHLDSEEATRKEAGQIGQNPNVIVATSDRIIDHLRRDNLSLDHVHAVVVDEPESDTAEGFNVDVQLILSKLPRRPHIAAFTPRLHEETGALIALLRRPRVREREDWQSAGPSEKSSRKEQTVSRQETSEKAKDETDKKTDKQSSGASPDKVKEQIQEVLRQIHEEENPDELNYYRKMVRKHVPFFMRGYFMAFLAKNGGIPKHKKKDAGQYTSMFIGVGKNRRVFPRDLIQLFSSVDEISAEDIGEIKILDNYSFAEITTEKAPALIRELNGTDYRGRKLTVNFARRKD